MTRAPLDSLPRAERASGLLRSGCEHLSKRGLKALWASASFESSALVFKNPNRKDDPLTEALTYLMLKERGVALPPFAPRFAQMSIPECCQLSLLWALAGEEKAAEQLARSLPLEFPWLWCKEGEYDEKEAKTSLALLRSSLGHSGQKIDLNSDSDLYFRALAERLPFLGPLEPEPSSAWSLYEIDRLRCAMTFEGERTGLGAILSPRAEVRAFGPQAFPLSDSRGFGIRPVASHENRWGSPFAMPEVWFEAKMRVQERQILLDLSFTGLKPDAPLAFSFYVKSDSAWLGSEVVKPKSLQRYFGDAKPILFSSSLKIESSLGGKMEVIPLAGTGCFWDCEYLLAFEIHPFNSKGSFSFSLI